MLKNKIVRLNQKQIDESLIYADKIKLQKESNRVYADSNQTDYSKIKVDANLGKMGEYAVYNFFKLNNLDITEVQKFSKNGLGWSPDFMYKNTICISVKTRDEGEQGWIIQDIPNGRRDKNLDNPNCRLILVTRLKNNIEFKIDECIKMVDAKERMTKEGLLPHLINSKWLLPEKGVIPMIPKYIPEKINFPYLREEFKKFKNN